MKDKLKQRFEESTDLDKILEASPPDGHRNQFEQRLKKESDSSSNGIKLIVSYRTIRRLSVAAILIIAITFTWLASDSKVVKDSPIEGMELAAISDKYYDVESFYKREVNSRLNLFENSKSEIEKSIYQEALAKLSKLETSYGQLEKELASNPDNLRVINSMIQNYQLRIKVLETLHKKLEINQTLKIDQNEKANNNDSQYVSGLINTYTA